MDTLKAARMLLDRQPLSEYLPYLAYDEKAKAYILDNAVGLVFECHPLPYPSSSAASTLRGLLETQFPAGTSLQIMLYTSRKIGAQLDAYVMYRENTHGNSMYSDFARQRAEYLQSGADVSLFKGCDIRVRDFRMIVSMAVPCSHTPHAINHVKDNVVPTMRDTVYQALNTAGLYPVSVGPEELINILSEILNPGHSLRDNLYYDPKAAIKDQVIYSDTETEIRKDCLVLDGYHVKSYTVKQYPREWDVSGIMSYTGDVYQNVKQIGAPFMLVLNCEYLDQLSARREIQKKATIASYQAYGQFAKWFPKIGMRKEHFDEFTVALEQGETPFKAYMNMFVYAKDAAEATSMASICQSLYRGMGFILQDDNYIMLPLFLQALPMAYHADAQRDLRRRRTFTTANVAEIAPIQSDWKGGGRPVLPLISRRGQLQFIDLFSNKRGGYSGVVCAGTGAGKSFFVNEMIVSYLGLGSKVWIIDVGRSYEKLCDILNGDFLVFDTATNMSLNPFSSVLDIDEEMTMLKAILAQMASNIPLDDLSQSYMEEAIKECFAEHGTSTSITDIASYLTAKPDSRQVDLGMKLYPYTSGGSYATFFEGASTFNPKGGFVCLELEELKSKKDLQEVVLLTLVYKIQQDMMQRGENKLVIIDEAWDLLTGGNTSQFMETGYRRFRKYGGACLSITQSINDFYKIPAGVAIVENSDYFFLLRQRAESIEALKQSQKVSLSEGMYDLLKSVHTDAGNYSEIFLYAPDGIAIGRLVVDRFTQLLYTTKPEEFLVLKQMTDSGMTIREAIVEQIRRETAATVH